MNRSVPTARTWRELWPLPALLGGLAAFWLSWWLVPVPAPLPKEQITLAVERALLALENDDPATAWREAEAVWPLVKRVPEKASLLRFVLGSACWLGRTGRIAGLDEASLVARARADLELVEGHQLPEALRPWWCYRLAQAGTAAEAAPEQQVRWWEEVARRHPPARADAYAQLIRLYPLLQPPQLDDALAASERWLMLPDVKDADHVRLLRGQLLLQAGKAEAARQTLARIGPKAPEAGVAMHLRALSHFKEAGWAAAARCWEDLLEVRGAAVPLEEARYYLGLCYLRLDLSDLAHDRWAPLLGATPASPERTAAQLKWALHQAESGANAATLEGLRIGLAEFIAANSSNRYLPKGELLAELRALRASWQNQQQLEAVLSLCAWMEPLADPGETDWVRGEAHEAAGRRALRMAETADGAEEEEQKLQARQAFRQAALAFARLAELQHPCPSDSSWNWRAAENCVRAGEFNQAIPWLEQELKRPLPAVRRTEVLLELAVALHGAGRANESISRLREALAQPGVVPPRARYLLAVTLLQERRLADAEAELRTLIGMDPVTPEPAEVRQARYALGYVLYWQGRFSEAARALENAVQQHPADSQSWSARYWWAEAVRQEALVHFQSGHSSQSNSARGYYESQRRQSLETALALFRKFTTDVAQTFMKQPAPGAVRQLEREARLGAGQCLLDLERATEALTLLEALALETAGTPEELNVLMHLAQGQLQLGRKADGRLTLSRLREQMGKLPEEAFSPPRRTRQQWLDWLGTADRSAQEGTAP